MWMMIISSIFEIVLLIIKAWFEKDAQKKKEIKELADEFKEAVKYRDYAYMDMLWLRARRLR